MMTNGAVHDPGSALRRIAAGLGLLGFVLAAGAATLAILSGPGYRWEWWGLRTGFTMLRWAAYGGLAAAILSLGGGVGLLVSGARRGLVAPALGLIVGLLVLYVPWSWRQTARSVPPIHDITTDLESPPEFVAVLPLRRDAPNPAEHGGPEVAAQQRAAYPDLRPVILDLAPDAAFERALEAAREMGWEMVAAEKAQGRIEATATTFWYGFKDDVVVRLTPVEGGTRVDVRSVSRVGRSDVGTNARRIRTYLRLLTGGSGS